MEYSTHDIVVLGFLALLALAAVVAVPSLWRSDSMPGAPKWWPYSTRFWRGLYRSMFIGVGGGVYLLIMVVGLVIWEATRPLEQQGTGAPLWAQIVLPSTFLLFPALMISVILFNRPKRVVPPAFRDQPGMLSRRWVEHRGSADK